MFILIFGHDRTENFPINEFEYSCWNGGYLQVLRLILIMDYFILVHV